MSESYWILNLHLQVGSVPFVVRALENTVALTVVSCCFAPRVIHFGIQITHNVLGTKVQLQDVRKMKMTLGNTK